MTARVPRPAYLHHHDEGEAIWFTDSLVTIKASAEDTAGSLGVMHVRAPRSAGSPVHEHRDEDESWYVLAGELRFWLGDVERRAVAGDYVFGPRGIPHRFCVESDGAEFLILVAPGGFEGFVRDTGWPASSRVLPEALLPQRTSAEIASSVLAHGLSFPIENTSSRT
jgi:quercetin dioxygenase-like cupin family protein